MREEDPADRILSPGGKLVDLDVEDLTTGVVAEQQQVGQCRDCVVAVDHDTGRGRAPLQQGVQLSVLGDRIRESGLASRIDQADLPSADEPVAALPVVPPQIGATGDETDFFDDVLTDVSEEHVAGRGVPAETLGIANPVGINLRQRTGAPGVGKRIVGGNAVVAIGAVGAERVNTQELPERPTEILPEAERVAAAAAVSGPDVEQTEIGVAR